MLRRSERNLHHYQLTSFYKIKHLTDMFQNNMKKNGTKDHRIYILNLLYNTVYSEFYDLRCDIHKKTNKKEEFFIHLLKTKKKRETVLLYELSQPDNQCKSSKILERIIIKTSDKIRKYIDTYNNERKEAFILLSSKIGIDMVKNITSYL